MLATTITIFIFTARFAAYSSEEIPEFHVIREWKYVNFTFPNEKELQSYVSKGLYVPQNNVITGVGYYDGFYYLTLPRMKNGVVATLARIPDQGDPHSPSLEPYPSWEYNRIDDCNALQNVQNIEIDSFGRIWIIDGGKTFTLSRVPTTKCPPRILIHNIKDNRTEVMYIFPNETVNHETGFLYDIVIDDSNGGYAYITDNSKIDPGMVVFSLSKMDSWKIRHVPSMTAQLDATEFEINRIPIKTPINVAGIALGPRSRKNNDRQVFYSPISSMHMFSINSSVLQNKNNSFSMFGGAVKDWGEKRSQSDGMIIDDQGILYYGLLATGSIVRWDTKTKFSGNQKMIARDPDFIQWPNSFTFNNKGELIVLTNRLHEFINGKVDLNSVNFRLLSALVGSNSYVFDKLHYMVNGTNNNDGAHVHIIGVTGNPMGKNTIEGNTEDNHIHFHMVTTNQPKTDGDKSGGDSLLGSCLLLWFSCAASIYFFRIK